MYINQLIHAEQNLECINQNWLKFNQFYLLNFENKRFCLLEIIFWVEEVLPSFIKCAFKSNLSISILSQESYIERYVKERNSYIYIMSNKDIKVKTSSDKSTIGYILASWIWFEYPSKYEKYLENKHFSSFFVVGQAYNIFFSYLNAFGHRFLIQLEPYQNICITR